MSKPKYIDAEQLKQAVETSMDMQDLYLPSHFFDVIDEQPAADVVEVVRCADCKYQEKGENDCESWNLCGYRPWLHIPTEDDAFCSKGERKDG